MAALCLFEKSIEDVPQDWRLRCMVRLDKFNSDDEALQFMVGLGKRYRDGHLQQHELWAERDALLKVMFMFT